MTLYNCHVLGVSPSGREWSFHIGFTSAASVTTVQSDWDAQVTSAWTNGSHGLEVLFPTATEANLIKTEQLATVVIGTVTKLRVVNIAQNTAALAGTSANAGMNDQDCILVSLRTALPGKEGRGRIHLPAPDETLVTASELALASATRVSAAITALLAGMATAGHQGVIITFKVPKSGTAVGSTRTITLPETDRIIRTMRGRVRSRRAVYA